ncbi:DUF975 family protein [bacterium 210820-DFI.6.37]|nr:DUF975 family protein [bacterium 210820-DFI.6.37]
MNNIIITEPSRNLRMLGRQALEGKWKVALTAVIVCQLCLELPVLILDELFGKTLTELFGNGDLLYGMDTGTGVDFMTIMSQSAQKISAMSGVYSFLVTGAFTLGLTMFFISLFRRKEADPAQVFSGFEYFFKALGLSFMVGLFTALWTLLFIVPGIIAMIRYSQAFFILADNPEKGIMECISESKWMMRGNKAKYFCMCLSFIGWIILTSVVVGIIVGIFSLPFGGGAFAAIITGILTVILTSPVSAYMTTTEAAFYDILTGNLRAETYTPGQY